MASLGGGVVKRSVRGSGAPPGVDRGREGGVEATLLVERVG